MTAGGYDTTTGSSHRPRWWQDARWITAGVIAATILFLLWGLFGPEAAIRVSRETTFITEPLAADGLPDYRAALLAMAGPAPPPEQNAAAALLQVCWPLGIDDADLPKVCAALGIPCEPPADPLRLPHKEPGSKITREMFDAATEQPWTGADLPEVDVWLAKNQEKIDGLLAASRLPRYWLPEPTLLHAEESMRGSWTFVDIESRYASNILRCRAMWLIGKRRYSEAWQCFLAVCRLSGFFVAPDRSPQLSSTQLSTIAMQSSANVAFRTHLLARTDLSPDVVNEIRRDWVMFGLPRSHGDLVVIDRLLALDWLVFVARRVRGGRHGDEHSFGLVASSDKKLMLRTSLDWNYVLKSVNDDYDNLESTIRLTNYGKRIAGAHQLVDAHRARTIHWCRSPRVPMSLCNRRYRSEGVALEVGGTIPLPPAWMGSFTCGESQRELTRIAVALAAWRLDHAGESTAYPERLNELVPKYLAAVPIDPFSGKPLIYERRSDGYLLASVGSNGVYDGGTDVDGWIVNGEWLREKQDVVSDEWDLVVRMPVPERPFIPPSAE